MFAPVTSAKNKELVGNLIKILLDPFYSQHSQFHVVSTKKHTKMTLLQVALPDFGLVTSQRKVF
jgi:hypothetical protein